MRTYKEWQGSKKCFSEFLTGLKYPEHYNKTFRTNFEPVEIDEELYHYFMEVLPPFYIKGGFQCSEPVCGNTYDTFTEKDGRYYYHGHGEYKAPWLNAEVGNG